MYGYIVLVMAMFSCAYTEVNVHSRVYIIIVSKKSKSSTCYAWN